MRSHLVIATALLGSICAMWSCRLPGAEPQAEGPTYTALDIKESLKPCKYSTRVLASAILSRDKGSPEVDEIPFDLPADVDTASVQGGPICVVVTSLDPKPRVLSSARFELDGNEILGPSSFNQNTPVAVATTTIGAGAHLLLARLSSAPGTRVRVQVLGGSGDKTPVPQDVASTRAVVMPDAETTISVGGARLTFPKGAVDAPLPITAFEVFEPYGIGDRVVLLPDGAQFDKPVEVELAYDPDRLPPSVTEASLLAADAIRIKHSGEWRPTVVNAATHRASSTITHFSHINVDSTVPIPYPDIAGGELTVDSTHDLLIARFPLRDPHVSATIRATYNADNDALELMQVRDHIANLTGDRLGLNLSNWWAVTEGDLGRGINGPGTGYGRSNWVTLYEPAKPLLDTFPREQCAACPATPAAETCGGTECSLVNGECILDDEYTIMIRNALDGMAAEAHRKVDREAAEKAMADPPGSQSVLIGSRTSLIKNGCSCRTDLGEAEGRPNSILGFNEDYLFLIASRNEVPIGGQELCDALTDQNIDRAILLDGGHSTSMVHNTETLNPLANPPGLFEPDYRPARRVVNALAIVSQAIEAPPAPVIVAPKFVGADQPVDIALVAFPDPNGDRVNLQCGSAGNFFQSGLHLGGGTFQPDPPFQWHAAGPATIYCTAFDEFGKPSSETKHFLQVVKFGSLQMNSMPSGVVVFTIHGQNMPDKLVAWVADCQSLEAGEDTLFTEGDSETRTFSCKPLSYGQKELQFKAKEGDPVILAHGSVTFGP